MPDTTNPCTSQPFMLLGDPNKAPVLDYHIPQKSCLPLYSVKPDVAEDKWFKPQDLVIDNYWTRLSTREKTVANLKKLLLQELKTGGKHFTKNVTALKKCATPVVVYDSTASLNSGVRYKSQSDSWVRLITVFGEKRELHYGYTAVPAKIRTVVPVEITGIAGSLTHKDEYIKKEISTLKIPKGIAIELDLQVMAEKLSKDYMIHFTARHGGHVTLHYIPRPTPKRIPAPKMYLKFVKELCSLTANYGAGETVNTLSLLPGERRSISIRTYRHSASTRSRSENVIDSISKSSVHSLENAIQQSTGSSSSYGESYSETDPGEVISVGTPAILDLVWASVDYTSQTPSTGSTTQSQLTNTSSTVTSAVEMQVNESNHFRNVTINSSTTSEVQEGEENLIVREIANINQSRTLNFVFRRLLQHYHTFLVLKDIKFGIVYFDSGSFHTKEVSIDKLEALIQEFVLPDYQVEAMQQLIKQSAFIYNHQNEQKQLFNCEEYTQPQIKCECSEFVIPAEQVCRWIKLPVEDTYQDFTMKGIILSHSEHVLKTESLLADAFLGQGEALDCYNTQLQQQNVKGVELNNQRTEQAINIIDGFGTSQEKADNYKKIYGECCDDQTNE